MIETIEGFLSPEECAALIALGRENTMAPSAMYDGLRLDWKVAEDIRPESGSSLEGVLTETDQRVMARASEVYDVTLVGHTPPNFYRYSEGSFYRAHNDSQVLEYRHLMILATKKRRRDVSSVLYLNENFEGGEFHFEFLDQTIEPRTGMLLLFPSGWQYQHSVKLITEGERFCLANWFESTPPLVAEQEKITDRKVLKTYREFMKIDGRLPE